MARLKRIARERGGERAVQAICNAEDVGDAPKKRKGTRPKKDRTVELKTLKVSVTISIRGGDKYVSLLDNAYNFLVKKTLAGKCSVERGGAAYHLHLQMVAQIQAPSLISVSKLVKKYLCWDMKKPPGAMVFCKSLSNNLGLHRFHGMIRYCSKDAEME